MCNGHLRDLEEREARAVAVSDERAIVEVRFNALNNDGSIAGTWVKQGLQTESWIIDNAKHWHPGKPLVKVTIYEEAEPYPLVKSWEGMIGDWEHLDGTRCRSFLAKRPRPSSGEHWWCTEHQQKVRHFSDKPTVVDSVAVVDAQALANSVKAEMFEFCADELWRVFLRLSGSPSPLGDYIQRRVSEHRARAKEIRG